jgi:type I restriction enzyme S subunit
MKLQHAQLPQGWNIKKLKEVCANITDGTHQTPTYFGDGFIFLSSKNVTSGKINWDEIKYIDTKQHLEMHKRVAPRLNDILLAKNGTTGVAAIVDRDVTFDIYVSLALLRVLDSVLPSFMLYFINSPLAKKQFNKRLKGIGVPNLHLNEIREVSIPFPKSISQQQRIVSILDETFASIAKAKANAEQNLKNAKELFESYLQSVFANKGKDWEEKTLKNIGVTQTGTTPKTDVKENFGDYIPFIKPADIDKSGDGNIRYDNEGLSEQGLKNGRKMEEGSILMVCIGASIGKVGFVNRKVSCNQQINSLTVKNEFCSKFFYYALSTKSFFEQVMQNAAQATLPIINKSKWEALSVSYPKSLTVQKSIVQKLDALSTETKKLESIYQQKITDLEELKKSILQKAFNGELTT